MAASLSGEFNLQEFTDAGALMAGGRLYTYAAGTTTQKIAYTDAAASVAHTYTSDGGGGQYIALNSRGELPAPLFLTSGGYDIALKTPAGVTVWTRRATGQNDSAVTADQVAFDVGATYSVGSIGEWLTNLVTSVGASFIGWIQSGTGAVLRTVQNKLRDTVNVLDFGAVMNSSGASVRTANSAALLAAAAVSNRVYMPPGTLWIDPNIEVPADLQLTGAGRQLTIIKGDGDLFKITQSAFGTPVFSDLTIANDVTRGKLFQTAVGADIGRVQFERVEFLKANYHIYSTDICVDWLLIGCRFNDAAIASRAFTAGIWAHNEIGCYTWFNAIGLYVSDNSSSCNIGGVFEYNTSYGIRLTANNAAHEIDGWSIKCHFEGNGSAAGDADVMLETTAATRIRSIDFSGSRFSTPNAAQTLRVNSSLAGGGNLDKVLFGPGTIIAGAAQLCPDSTGFIVAQGVYFQNNGPRSTNMVPLAAQSQFSSHLGAAVVIGVSGGNGQVQATVTPPTGTKLAMIYVQGNSYNGVANTHDGYLEAIYRVSGNRIAALHDVNNSAGSAQGFVATWTGTQIQIANKTGMTNVQSGDTTIVFYG